MADIFISYSQKDRRRVEPLVDALKAEGHQVWWDLEIRAGERFDERIESTLEKVQCVITVWSERSVASRWVRAESSWADDHGKFVSIRIDEEIELPLKFRHVHTRSLVGWKSARDATAFQDLLADIAEIAGPPPLPDLPSESKPKSVPNAPRDLPADISKVGSPPSPRRSPSSPPGPGSVANAPKPPVSPRRWIGVAGLIVVVIGTLVGGIIWLFLEQNKTVFRDILEDGSQGPAMVVIPGGSFRMGSPPDEPRRDDDEGPVHGVNLRPFAMGRTEVTFAQYDRFAVATGRKKPDDEGWGRGERPVIDVSWKDAMAYAAWLSAQTGESYRLPTEAEWEYAARAGTSTPFRTGNCIHTDQANYNGNYDYNNCGARTRVYRQRTVPAGSLPANPWGLHEVAGNVREWTQDCRHESYQGAPSDGSAWGQENGGDCARRVVRGGGWVGRPRILRSANRDRDTTDDALNNLGFRLARDL